MARRTARSTTRSATRRAYGSDDAWWERRRRVRPGGAGQHPIYRRAHHSGQQVSARIEAAAELAVGRGGGVIRQETQGDRGDDRLYGTAGTNFLSGGIGNDGLIGGDGDDGLNGDEGDDRRQQKLRRIAYGGADSGSTRALQKMPKTANIRKAIPPRICRTRSCRNSASMDRIVVMDAGTIVEEGTHEALLARSGLYARYWNRQSGGFLQMDAEAAE